jgi:hypothetical protein
METMAPIVAPAAAMGRAMKKDFWPFVHPVQSRATSLY